MRLIPVLLLLATPLHAWEFSPTPVCTLTDAKSGTVLTYDGAVYDITLTRPGGWPLADVFAIRFAPVGPTISTSRHQVEGDTLRVEDRGFGNVLNGLELNTTATALTGDAALTIDLTGAAAPTRAFRACTPGPAIG